MIKKDLKENEFNIYWQCSNCGEVNIDIANNAILDITEFKCRYCKKTFTLQKKITQVLCVPSIA